MELTAFEGNRQATKTIWWGAAQIVAGCIPVRKLRAQQAHFVSFTLGRITL